MNPYRPLMGIVVALLLCCGQAWAATVPWMEVTSGKSKFFIPKTEYEALKAQKIGAWKPLYKQADEKAKSTARLVKKTESALIVFIGAQKEMELAVKDVSEVAPPVTVKPVPPVAAPLPQTSAAPAGVDADVWAAIQKDGSIGDDRKAYAAQVLQLVKANNKEGYAKAQTDQAAMRRLLAQIMLLGPEAKNDAKQAYAELTKVNSGKTKLSVALNDEALPNQNAGAGVAPASAVGAAVDAGNLTDPKNQNRDLLMVLKKFLHEKPSVYGPMMGERFFAFMTGTEGGDYLSPELRKDKTEIDLLKPIAMTFVQKLIDEGKSGEVAELYWVMGSGPSAKAGWAPDDLLIQQLAKEDRWSRTTLLDNLKPWTGAKGTGLDVRAQINRSKPDQAKDFLVDASSHAAKILRNPSSKKELSASIFAREEKPVVAGDVGSGAGTIKGPAKGFNWDTLYRQGGITTTIYADGDPVAREITFKIYTVKDEKTGAMVNKLGIFDTSYPSDTFGQKFAIGPGESTFALDDRVKGMPDYKLTMAPTPDGDMAITFGRDGKGGMGFSKKLSELYDVRAQHVIDQGSTMEINGKSFLVMGQGGKNGSLLFYPSDLANRKGADRSPELMTNVNERSGDGRSVNLSGAQALGNVKGEHYNLEFNRELGYWEAKKGPPPAKPVAAAGGGAAGGADKQTSSTNGQANPPGGDIPGDVTVFEQGLVNSGKWIRNDDVRNGLDENYKEKVRVYSWIGKLEDGSPEPKQLRGRHIMIVPEGVWSKDRNPVPPFAVTKEDTDLNVRVEGQFKGEIRGFGKWLATSTDLNTLYFDLSRPDPKTMASLKAGGDPQGSIYVNEGSVSGNKTISIFDAILLPDAMLRGGFSEAEVKGAVVNLAKVLGDMKTGFQISGAKGGQLGVVIAGKKNMYFWPEIKEDPSAVDPSKAGVVGDGTVFDKVITGGQDAELGGGPTEVKAVDGVNDIVTRIKDDGKKGPTAALYVAKARDDKQPLNYYLMFRFKNNDDKIMRTSFLQVFGGKDMPAFPGEGIIFLSGATDIKPSVDVSGSGKVTLLGAKGKDKGRGVYAFFETRLDEADKTLKTGNCIGPVLWWGVDEATAKAACKNSALP